MHVFADRIIKATLVEGTVRLQFVAAHGGKDDSGNLIHETVQTVIMSEEGFLKSLGTLNGAKDEIAKAKTRGKTVEV